MAGTLASTFHPTPGVESPPDHCPSSSVKCLGLLVRSISLRASEELASCNLTEWEASWTICHGGPKPPEVKELPLLIPRWFLGLLLCDGVFGLPIRKCSFCIPVLDWKWAALPRSEGCKARGREHVPRE